ncbi:MAG: phage tail assembly chaperone [Parvibaculum sp.]|uniref:rcc01693 family protein n=1 Tax=Parvibaculum sp. TaxID=2024848 RepID=UPI0025DB602E|nr:rcc01693 family protein [Parvibaculum sp.]MCE9650574.1 phage tail assembly chaperone [Parvibaculum sp.]
MKTFPWARAMEIGLGHLRLAPQEFWRMTLPELAAATRGLGIIQNADALSRADFENLMAEFPDETKIR